MFSAYDLLLLFSLEKRCWRLWLMYRRVEDSQHNSNADIRVGLSMHDVANSIETRGCEGSLFPVYTYWTFLHSW
jgi:hypothetical protein